jgi:WD40 repeat protein
VPQPQHTITELHNGPICRAEFAADGSRLATCSSDQTAHCLRLPVAKHNGDGVTCTGHTGRVSSVSFSSRGDRLITAGDDRTACVWVAGRAEPALVIDTIERNLPPVQKVSSPIGPAAGASTPTKSFSSPLAAGGRGSGGSSGGGGVPNSHFGSEIVRAQFFHGDRLLLVGCGTSIGMYGYSLHQNEGGGGGGGGGAGLGRGGRDNKPHLSQGRYRRAHSYAMSGLPVLTALAAVNGIGMATRSVLAAGSNKSLEVIDVSGEAGGGGGITLTIPSAHNRPVHCIALASPGASATGDGSGSGGSPDDVFMTAATDGAIRLWDVRDPCVSRGQCVQVWTAHTNRVHPLGAALSPCGRFAACGSEDKLAYVYDLRRSDGAGGKEALWKLRGHTDAVLDVAFNPVHPQLATVGADGKLLFFCEKSDGYL